MASQTETTTEVVAPEGHTMLKLITAYGPVYRPVKTAEPRDVYLGEIPIIDISSIYSENIADRQHIADQIRDAASTIGFFYIKGH